MSILKDYKHAMKSFIPLLFICLFFSACQPEATKKQNALGGEVPLETQNAAINPSVQIVDKQLDAYNAHDIEAFVATYADSVEIYNPKGQLLMKGHEQLRNGYSDFFANTPKLHCKILSRISINNTVIDKEEVIINDSTTIYGVAVYEVANGKITSVSFID
ncbi:MAG: hypothetical protein ACI9XJ_002210 [Marivirga sp.]|jgi:hypothetical protein